MAAMGCLAFAVGLWLQTADFSRRTGLMLYPLDDTYIHLALARTLALTGEWAVVPGRPAAASSSPLFALLLAACRRLISGDIANSWAPLAINIAAAVGLVAIWRRVVPKGHMRGLALLVLTFALPLPALALIGMEHVLDCTLTLWLALAVAERLTSGERLDGQAGLGLAALAALAAATRYESLFLVAGAVLLALSRRRLDLAAVLTLGAAAPVAGFGLAWIHAGGWLVPNALLLKTAAAAGHDPLSLARAILGTVISNLAPAIAPGARLAATTLPTVGLAILLSLALFRAVLARPRPQFGSGEIVAALAVFSTLAQIVLGSLGWLFRYEAWLINLDVAALVMLAAARLGARPRMGIGVLALVGLLIAPRAVIVSLTVAQAAKDRLWEHFAVTQMLGERFPGQTVLVNDIGVLAYLRGVLPADIYGLGDNEPLRARRAGVYGPAQAGEFARARGARIGVLKICWDDINRRIPPGWVLTDIWRGSRDVVFQDVTVGFFADSPQQATRLGAALDATPTPAGVLRIPSTDSRIKAFNAGADRRQESVRLCRGAAPETAHP